MTADKPEPLSDEEEARVRRHVSDSPEWFAEQGPRIIATIDRERAARVEAEKSVADLHRHICRGDHGDVRVNYDCAFSGIMQLRESVEEASHDRDTFDTDRIDAVARAEAAERKLAEAVEALETARPAAEWLVDHAHRAHEYDRGHAVLALSKIKDALARLRETT